ncbi:NAD(P)-dependent oxidoreductase [Halioxenophilus sp. WMMB6]|uniref:NAD(P)-dependent oxidoreductase n=1 Tax=Halioxenophilus sp. WMMB6 TaxID=3073815 RepID=UPI00295F2F4B|nr:NAD(P)-dependent oxidoreductase [Halioxenophilus sp. WMMB6]
MRIALLGVGAMHSRMAKNLIRAGFDLALYNRTSEACADLTALGAKAYATPCLAVEQADVVIAMVTDNDAARAVWLAPETGAVHGLSPRHIAIESSTLGVDCCQALAAAIQPTGAQFIDAPVMGSLPHAEQRQLIYLAGGNPQAIAQVQPVLQVNAKTVLHVGEQGAGMKLKLVANTLFALQLAAMAELMGVLQQTGLPLTQVAPLLEQLPVTSPVMTAALHLMRKGQFAPLFPVDLVVKDLGYMAQYAADAAAPAPLAEQTAAVFQQAQFEGLGWENITSVMKLYLESR